MGVRFNRKDCPGVLHYVTLNIRERRPLFRWEEYARMILYKLHEQCQEHPAKLIAYVAMLEHLHYIINPRDGQLTRFLAQFKPSTSLAMVDVATVCRHDSVLRRLHTTPTAAPQLWQDGKHSFHLWTNWMIWQKINYIHSNPTRRMLVQHAGDYPFSSFNAMYPGELEPVIPIDREWWWEE